MISPSQGRENPGGSKAGPGRKQYWLTHISLGKATLAQSIDGTGPAFVLKLQLSKICNVLKI